MLVFLNLNCHRKLDKCLQSSLICLLSAWYHLVTILLSNEAIKMLHYFVTYFPLKKPT